MNARRTLGSIVFAAAAFASIATSAPAGWQVEDQAFIPLTDVQAGPGTAFSITSEARGPANLHNGGDLEISVQIRRVGDAFPAVKVRLISETNPSLNQQREVGEGDTTVFFVPAWESCEVSPCFEDLRLEVENTVPGSSINVSGDVRAVLFGDGSVSSDHEVVVEVTPLGDIP